jgi:hypothetical protein
MFSRERLQLLQEVWRPILSNVFLNTQSKIGANGLGEAYVRALVTAGYVSRTIRFKGEIIDPIIRARVCVGDSDEERGRKLEQELDG